MKILHVIDSGGIHGAEVMLLGLASEQIRQGMEPMIVSIGLPKENDKPIETEARKENVPFYPIRMRAGLNFYGAYKIVQFALKHNFQIYHVHGYKAHILLGLLPEIIRKLPIIATVHGWTAVKIWSMLRLYRLVDEISLHFMNVVVFVNKGTAVQPLIRKLGTRAVTVPNGIPPLCSSQSFFPGEKIADFCNGAFVVGSIGRLSPEKAYDHLIQAFAQFHKHRSNAKLLIIGEGCERAILEQCAQTLGIIDHVLLPGYFNEAWRYMQLMDVYVISSLTEGLPITLLEAMQCRIPIIATAVGGIPEVLQSGEAGILYKSGDNNALEKGLECLYTDTAHRNKLIESAYIVVNRQYTCQSMTSQYAVLYKKMLNLK